MTTMPQYAPQAPDFFRIPIPDTDPEPEPISRENLTQPQTEFERILYAMAYQQPDRARRLMERYFELLPDYTGEPGDRDVWHPDATGPVEIPRHWKTTPVHMLPGGFGNDRTLRMTILGKRMYYFTQEQNLEIYLSRVHGHRTPERIIDLGCGTATTTFTYARLFPQAEVFGIDLSAPYIRWDREQAQARGLANLHFYQDNAERTHFPDASFDIVHFTYVLHEMPRKNSFRILQECFRLARPGGVVSAMDVQCLEEPEAKAARVKRGKRGEPFLADYMRLDLPNALREVGFTDLELHESNNDGVFFTAVKPG